MSAQAYFVGALYITFSALFVPFYLRIIYVFLSTKYRSTKCYQIMIQIGLVQCIMGLSFLLQGISTLSGSDLMGITNFSVAVLSAFFRVETGLGFVLALDRLVIVCDLKFPKFVVNTLLLLAWMYGIIQIVIFMTPLASLRFSLTKFVAIYDYSFPLSTTVKMTGLYYSWAVSALTLIIYVVIVIYLIHQQTRLTTVVSRGFKQKWILIQAVVRFIFDASITVLFHVIPKVLNPSIWITVGIITGYEFNHLLLPPLLYAILNGLLTMSADRAAKSGLALEAQRKIHSKYDEVLANQILVWLSNTIGEGINTSGNVDNFNSLLKDGKVLCKLANSLSPGAVRKVNESAMAFKQMENISFFLNFAMKHMDKSEIFQTADLYEGQDPNAVLVCLSSLARKSEKLFGKPGLGPKEAEGEKRQWTNEQLRAGDAIIGLQMGSNKGANASGINMGNTRHM